MSVSIEMLYECLNDDDLYKLGGNLICSDSFGNELWNFGDDEHPLYVQRHVDLYGNNCAKWSSEIDVLEGWFVFDDDDEWVEQRLK